MKSKKCIIFVICIMLLNLLVVGCAKTEPIKENDNSALDNEPTVEEKYEDFKKDYNKILENFQMKDFEELGDYRGITITDTEPSKIFPEENDMLNNDTNKPIRKNIYYYNKKDKVFINITHIFIETSMGNHLLTSDYPIQDFNDNGIAVPLYNEHFMCYDNTLVSLKTVYTGKKKDFSIWKYYIEALKEYERVLETAQ